ncbi:MAG: isocitrate/isopropylmalate dehydrogenase family protein [Firmicutes bacterium]|nr:isocitrate/isopropylmalate dehydrogenase family protein [Bacillota bacterium]
MRHTVTLIPGDGTGPELVEAAVRVLEATGITFDWDVQEAGEAALARYGVPLPDKVLESLRRTRVGLKGPITTPVGSGFRSVNVALRQELDLYACVRPCRTFPGVPAPFSGVDLVIVRENTEDVYAGVEFEADSAEAEQIRAWTGKRIRQDAAIALKPISAYGSRRVVEYAFEYAVRHRRRRVTAITKANIMKFTDGLFLREARQVAAAYAGRIEYSEVLVDAACMQLVTRPEEFDVLVMPNLYGDILSDLCAGLIGGLGMAPGVNAGDEIALFEPVHGSAPQFKGTNRLNPAAIILSGALMLRHLGEEAAASRVEAAVARVVREGTHVTFDLKPPGQQAAASGTREMADAIVRAMKEA